MKKLLSIAMALVMVLSLTVFVAAEEVLVSEDTMFFENGGWVQYETTIATEDFVAALGTPGAYLVITRSAPATADMMYTNGGWEKFCIHDSWWAGSYPTADGNTHGNLALGTANHTLAMTTEAGYPYDLDIDCVLDDGLNVWYDAATILDAWTVGNFNTSGAKLMVVSNSSPDAVYDIVRVAVVVPDEPIAVPETEAPTEEETEAPADAETEAPADDTTDAPADDEEPADTGLALAVVPAVVALAAVALSKKR